VDFGVVWDNLPVLLYATRLTILVSVAGFAVAVIAGLALTLLRRSRFTPAAWFAFAWTNFFRGSALYVLIVWLYFGIAVAADITLGALTAGVLTLALLNSAYLSEVFRSALDAVDPGQTEAALAMGLTRAQALRSVVAPQALRVALPATGNHFVDTVKDSAILLVIGVPELMRETARLADFEFRPFEFYTAGAAIYLLLVYAVAGLFRLLERRLSLAPRTSVRLTPGPRGA
jgi:His/Glu/Gln/Arg/opine family amino acid ABC transporter permease subunit